MAAKFTALEGYQGESSERLPGFPAGPKFGTPKFKEQQEKYEAAGRYSGANTQYDRRPLTTDEIQKLAADINARRLAAVQKPKR